MSAGHIFAVINSATVTGNDFLVLMRLADYANPDTGEAFPSMATLVKRCCISEATVHRSLANLVEEGSIEKISGGGFVNGKNETARYRLRYTPESRKQTGSQNETPGVSHCSERGSQNETQTVLRERSSSSHRTTFSEKNSEHGCFSQAKKEKKQRLTLEFVLDAVRPDLTLQSPSFVDAWKRWVEYRLQLRNPSVAGFQIHMARFAVMGPHRAIAAIDHSISNGYQGMFEPKFQPTQNKRSESCL